MLYIELYVGTAINTTHHAETRLQKYLFDGYDPNVRPTNNSNSIKVSMDVFLNHIVKLDEIKQTVTLSLSFYVAWTDGLLVWNVEDYNGIENIVIRSNKVWVPDIVNINAAEDFGDFGFSQGWLQLSNDGKILLWTQKTKENTCKIHTLKFPFDEHHCYLLFTLFMNTDSTVQLNASKPNIDLAWYKAVAEWEISENIVEVSSHYDEYLLTTYTLIRYRLSFKRNCKLCIMNILVPVILLSLLNLFTFLVPISSGEKLAYPMSIFLTVAVFLTAINGSLPEAVDGVSYIAIWVTIQLGFCASTLFCTVCTLRLYHSSASSNVPDVIVRYTRTLMSNNSFKIKQIKDNVEGQLNVKPEKDSENREKYTEMTRDNQDERKTIDWTDLATVLDKLMFYLFAMAQFVTAVIFVYLFLS